MSSALVRTGRLVLVITVIAVWHLAARTAAYFAIDNSTESEGGYHPRPAFSLRHFSWSSPTEVLLYHFVGAGCLVFAALLVFVVGGALFEIVRWIWTGKPSLFATQDTEEDYCSDANCTCAGHHQSEVFRDGEWHFAACTNSHCTCPDFHSNQVWNNGQWTET